MEKINDMIEHSKIETLNRAISRYSVHIFRALEQFKNDGVITKEEFTALRRDPSKMVQFYGQKGFTNKQINAILEENEKRISAIAERKVLRENAEVEMEKEFKIVDEEISKIAAKKAALLNKEKDDISKDEAKLNELTIRNYDLQIANCYATKELITLNHSSLVSDDLYEIANTKSHRGHEYARVKADIDDKIQANGEEIYDNRIIIDILKQRIKEDRIEKARKEQESKKEIIPVKPEVKSEDKREVKKQEPKKETALTPITDPVVYGKVKDITRNILMYKSILGKNNTGLTDEDIKRYIASYESSIKELRGENNKNLPEAELHRIYTELIQEDYVVNNLGSKPVKNVSPKEEVRNNPNPNNIKIEEILRDHYASIAEARKDPDSNKPSKEEIISNFFASVADARKDSTSNSVNIEHTSNGFFVTDEEIEEARRNSIYNKQVNNGAPSNTMNDRRQEPVVNNNSNNNVDDLDVQIARAQAILRDLLIQKQIRDMMAAYQPVSPVVNPVPTAAASVQPAPAKKVSENAEIKPSASVKGKTPDKKTNDVQKFKEDNGSENKEEIKVVDKKTIEEQPLTLREKIRKNWKKYVAGGIAAIVVIIGASKFANWLNKQALDNEKNKVDTTSKIEETVKPTDNSKDEGSEATPTPSPVKTDENGNWYINEEDLNNNANEPVVVPTQPAQEVDPSNIDNRPEGDYEDVFDQPSTTVTPAPTSSTTNNGTSVVATSLNNVNKSFAVEENTSAGYTPRNDVNSSFATQDNTASQDYSSTSDSSSTSDLTINDVPVKNEDLYNYYIKQTKINETLLNGGTVADYSAESALADEIKAIRESGGTDPVMIEKAIAKSKYLLNILKEDVTEEQKAEFAQDFEVIDADGYDKLLVDAITLTGYSNLNHENYTTLLHNEAVKAIGQKAPVMVPHRK